MQPRSPRNSGPTTELAKQRNQAAAERTLLAWIQNSLMLLGLGITLNYVAASLLQNASSFNEAIAQSAFDSLSLLVIPLGLILLALAIWQYRLSVRSLRRKNDVLLPSQLMVIVAVVSVTLFGIISAVIVLFRSV